MRGGGEGLCVTKCFCLPSLFNLTKAVWSRPRSSPGGVILDSADLPQEPLPTHSLLSCPLVLFSPRVSLASKGLHYQKDTLSLLQGAAQTRKASGTPFSAVTLFNKLPTLRERLFKSKSTQHLRDTRSHPGDKGQKKKKGVNRRVLKRRGGIRIMRRNLDDGSAHFFPLLLKQVCRFLSLRTMTGKLVG